MPFSNITSSSTRYHRMIQHEHQPARRTRTSTMRNCNSCWMAAGGGWAIHGLCVWWCCGGVVVFRGVVKRSTKSAWYPAGRAQPRPTRRPSRGRRRQGLARSGIPSTRTLYERHGCCSYCCTRGTVAAALLYLCIIILEYHPEMLYVPVCRTTTTAVHSTVVFCRFRISRPAVPGTRHDTTRVSTSTPNENVDHEGLQLVLDGCWRRLGNTWVVRVVVLWCCGIPRCFEVQKKLTFFNFL